MKRSMMISTLVFAILGSVLYTNLFAAQPGSFDKQQTQQIEKIIHDYLIKKPEILIEVSQALQKKQLTKASNKAKKAIGTNAKKLFHNPDSPVMGNKIGKTMLLEFLDYQCGHCKTMATVLNDVMKTHPGVKVVIKELPIFGKSSDFAARAAISASRLNKALFSKFHNSLLSQKKALSNDTVLKLAKESGLDVNKLKADMEKEEVKNQVKENFELAQQIGLQGTPAFIVSNNDGSKSVYIPGATTKAKLESAIKEINT